MPNIHSLLCGIRGPRLLGATFLLESRTFARTSEAAAAVLEIGDAARPPTSEQKCRERKELKEKWKFAVDLSRSSADR